MRGPRKRASLRLRPPVVSLGSHVVLEDLDDHTFDEYMLVPPAESNVDEGRLSSESPVGRAIRGHCEGEIVNARAPHRIRHLRITGLHV